MCNQENVNVRKEDEKVAHGYVARCLNFLTRVTRGVENNDTVCTLHR